MSEHDEIRQLWSVLYSDKLAFSAVVFVPVFSCIIGLYVR